MSIKTHCKRIVLVWALSLSALWATNIPGTITLYNDSPFILTASVYSHSGDFLGQVTLQPGQQKNFVSNLGSTGIDRPGSPEVSITPYRVIWQCASGGYYSMCTDASVGAFVRATYCPGQLHCAPKEEKKKPGAPPPPPPKNQ